MMRKDNMLTYRASRKFNHVAFVLLLTTVVSLLPHLQTWAQGTKANAPIVLNTQNPSIDAVLRPNNGASGAVAIDLQNAQLQLRNAQNIVTMTVADPRVTMVTIQLAEGAGPQTLHVDRLPGVAIAQVNLTATEALPDANVTPVSDPIAALDVPKMAKVVLDPSLSLPVTTTETNGLIRMEFSQGPQQVQVKDATGIVLLDAQAGDQMSGLALQVAPGNYTLNVANKTASTKTELLVALGPKVSPSLADQPVQPVAGDNTTASNTKSNANQANGACTAAIKSNSVSMRSGPGTAYTTLGFATQDNTLAVGGVNKDQNWVLVQGQGSGAWVPNTAVALSGDCGGLTVFDIPTRNQQAQAPVVINRSNPVVKTAPTVPPPSVVQVKSDEHQERQEAEKSEGGENQEKGGGHDD